MKLVPPLNRGAVLGRPRPSMLSDPAAQWGCLCAKALPLATQGPRDGGLVSLHVSVVGSGRGRPSPERASCSLCRRLPLGARIERATALRR